MITIFLPHVDIGHFLLSLPPSPGLKPLLSTSIQNKLIWFSAEFYLFLMSQRLIRQTVHQNAHNDQQFIHKTTHFLLRDNYKSLMGKFILPYSPALTWQVQCHQPHITYYGDPSPQCIFFFNFPLCTMVILLFTDHMYSVWYPQWRPLIYHMQWHLSISKISITREMGIAFSKLKLATSCQSTLSIVWLVIKVLTPPDIKFSVLKSTVHVNSMYLQPIDSTEGARARSWCTHSDATVVSQIPNSNSNSASLLGIKTI